MEKQNGVLMPIVRYSLIALGTTLVHKGYITNEELNMLVGALMTIGTVAWLVFNKKYRGI